MPPPQPPALLRDNLRPFSGQFALCVAGMMLLLAGTSFTGPPPRRSHFAGADAALIPLREMGMPVDARIINGESPWLLCQGVNRAYHTHGVVCECEHFKSIDDLSDRDGVIAIIDVSPSSSEYVAVLEVDEQGVTVATTLDGTMRYSRKEFRAKWRGGAIVFTRKLRWATDYL